ncbi:hypothetical protein R5W24_003743 [Gemmata sp. JC717]|uniref:hypothetical protein n=1 Tax=Gemmata algarum TaxID=2975278 RepID=UPI0021BABC34|nr:hypothetical protein [Gemmata algarum]MDY3554617.1 hypothetical protein [Gemmata algarum]
MTTRRSWFAAALLLVGLLVPLATSQDKSADPAKQRDDQQKIKARIDEAARRTSSTLDALMFQRLAPGAEQKMLRGVADDLRGLSETEIRAVLAHLEAAVAAPANATKEQREAAEASKTIMTQLKVMLGQLDVIKNLDEAADRLERAAEKQIALIGDTHTNTTLPSRGSVRIDDRGPLAAEQGELRVEVLAVFKQVNRLVTEKLLTPDQLTRLERTEALSRGAKLAEDMKDTAGLLKAGAFTSASVPQRRHTKELKDLAAALRTPPASRLDALKKAQAEVNKAIDAQTKVNRDTAERLDAAEVRRIQRQGSDPNTVRANELANQQTKAEFAARDAHKATFEAAPDVAEKLRSAERKEWDAEEKLRNRDIASAKEPQQKALEELNEAKDELDRQIAAAELAKVDSLAATKQAAERLDAIIKEQKDTNAKTDKAAAKPERAPEAATAQKDVAKKTEELRSAPLPPNTDAKAALDKALDAQKQAAAQLDNQQPDAAKPKQQDALQALERAKDELEKQAKAIEERRAEIAKLEELKGKLDELAKGEKDVAKAAGKAAGDPKKPETEDLAKKQADLNQSTKDVGAELKELAPDAAGKVGDANMKQEGAQSDLAMNMPMAGGQKAKEAADKLADAAKDVQKKIDEKKGQEAADQAALQPNKVDPQQAAQQLAKAIEQAKEAAEKAKTAQPLNVPEGVPTDAKQKDGPQILALQKYIAIKAAEQNMPDAAKAADLAAKAFEKGDVPQCIEYQERALGALKKAKVEQDKKAELDKKGDKGPPDNPCAPLDDKGAGDKEIKELIEKYKLPERPTTDQLIDLQQKVLDATKALRRSQQANAEAQAALQQAQANAPMAVQNQLQQAGDQLQKAGDQLQKGQPDQAGMSQQQAAQGLQQALDALNRAAMAQGTPGAQPGMGQMAQAGMGMGMQPGTGMGTEPGMGMGMAQTGMGMQPGTTGMGMGTSQQSTNMGTSEGDRADGEKLKNAGSSGTGTTGDGAFIKLRSKDRDKVQQTTDAQFPAEFRELIKQYNVTIKNGKPMGTAPRGK